MMEPLAAFGAHDHAACIATALEAARAHCASHGLRLTAVRETALKILLESHRALGAYELLARLREAGFGGQPPVAYRALDFLTSNGLAHRIEKMNAYVACAHPGAAHQPTFLICTECGCVGEHAGINAAQLLGDATRSAGFDVTRAVVELEGRCANCANCAKS